MHWAFDSQYSWQTVADSVPHISCSWYPLIASADKICFQYFIIISWCIKFQLGLGKILLTNSNFKKLMEDYISN